jgi:hypothetical protein
MGIAGRESFMAGRKSREENGGDGEVGGDVAVV